MSERVTIPGVLAAGDRLTMAGIMVKIHNRDRRWWQWWKPRMIDGPKLQMFRITSA